jgi:uncharacterized integral membrane protein
MSNDATPESKTDKRPDNWKIAAGAAGVLLIWFAIDNRSSVPIHFWITTYRAPLILVIIVAALLGGLMVGLWRRSRSLRS